MATLTGRSEFPRMFDSREDVGRSIWPRKKTLLKEWIIYIDQLTLKKSFSAENNLPDEGQI